MSVDQAIRAALLEVLRSPEGQAAIRNAVGRPEAAPAPAPADDCYTVEQAAHLAQLNQQTVRKKCRDGEFDAYHPGGGRGWRIVKTSFHAWLRKEQPETDGAGEVDIDAEARKIASHVRKGA